MTGQSLTKILAAFLAAFALAGCGADDSGAVAATTSADAAPASAAQAPPAAAVNNAATQAQPAAATAAQTATTNKARAAIDPAMIAAGDAKFQAGRDYALLTPAQRTSSPPEMVELTEVFMHQCVHCFNFESTIDRIVAEAPAGVNFVRVPAIFNSIAKMHAAAFYAAESLGVYDQLHMPLFKEIHVNRNRMANEKTLLDFVEAQGIDRPSFEKAMKSFAVDGNVRNAEDLNRRYRISSVPTLVVNGKYVTSASLVGSTDRLREVIDYLVAKELAEL